MLLLYIFLIALTRSGLSANAPYPTSPEMFRFAAYSILMSVSVSNEALNKEKGNKKNVILAFRNTISPSVVVKQRIRHARI